MSKSALTSEPSEIFARVIDWNLFKVFYEIGRRGGIGAAARSLNKQQPSISAALQRLESQVGATLCTRTSRGIALTVEGQQIFAACETIYGAAQSMPRAASAAGRNITGSVSLRVISHLHLAADVTEIFDDFHARYPHIEIKLDVAPWREVLKSLEHGEVELGIGFADELDERSLYVPILMQTQQIYCGSKHPLFGKAPVAPEDLGGERFVVTRDEPTPYIRYRHRYELGHHIGGFADSLQERMWLIQLGMGIGFLPKSIVDASSFASSLWPLLPDDEAPVCELYFMANAGNVRSAPAQLFLDTALRRLSPRQPERRDIDGPSAHRASGAANLFGAPA